MFDLFLARTKHNTNTRVAPVRIGQLRVLIFAQKPVVSVGEKVTHIKNWVREFRCSLPARMNFSN